MKNKNLKQLCSALILSLLFNVVIQVPVQGDSCLAKEDKSGYYMVSPKNAKLFQQIEKFVFVEKGVVKFDSKKAEKEKCSATVLDIGKIIDKMSKVYKIHKDGFLKKDNKLKGFRYKVWGRYCGPGHTSKKKPKDLLDSLCRKHDRCYNKKYHYFACSCDRALKRSILRNLRYMRGKQRKTAIAIYLYFRIAPCNPFF